MNWRLLVRLASLGLAAGALALAFVGCSKKGGGEHSDLLGQNTGSVPGVQWSVPKRWEVEGQRSPMRAASYTIPPAEGESEAAECAVFYFESGQGGSVDANIERWAGQFDQPTGPERAMKDVDGMKVTTVKIGGTYLAPSGPMMMPSAKKDNYKLLGAIVEAPKGLVVFKFTGPARTIDNASNEFDALVGSLKKQ